MVTVSLKGLELELKKRGWEQHRDFAVSELKKGRNIKEVLKNIAEMDAEDFIKNLQNPQKLYLPESYKQGESEIILGVKEKIEGYLDVKGKAKIIPKCHRNQNPYRRGNILACTDDPEETIE
ncbi:MAG: hypothetical protein CEE42_10190 [Promethearchaeota archaeon Loki_b31]|nr:MAG: hypothetical protein CEE42_10190 [Candidatus Lokiarchaeota archaeon Loki_b31]